VTREELRYLLHTKGVSPETYCLDGGLPAECYVLDESYGKWSVYYSERGHRNDEAVFRSEDEACRHLLELLLGDPTTRRYAASQEDD